MLSPPSFLSRCLLQDLPGDEAMEDALPDYLPIVSISKQLDTVLARLHLLEDMSAQRSPPRSPLQLHAEGAVSPARSAQPSPVRSRPRSPVRDRDREPWPDVQVCIREIERE